MLFHDLAGFSPETLTVWQITEVHLVSWQIIALSSACVVARCPQLSRTGHGVILGHGVAMLGHGVVMLGHGVVILGHGVIVLVHGVIVLGHGIIVLGRDVIVLGHGVIVLRHGICTVKQTWCYCADAWCLHCQADMVPAMYGFICQACSTLPCQ